ncbi:restriction endonuclease subunit S [Phocaeicola salanitronis]|uniref:restriction endonuclease subunit S n=1 Tax=Phocaeicola salanitronis TaxID=376805 RepID=UPI003208B6C0
MSSYYEKFLSTGEVKCIDDEIPFEIPNSWEWERWGNISQSIQYGYNAPALENGDIRMVRISDIQNNKVLWENVPFCLINTSEIETYLLKVNDILFARTGGTVGKSFLVEDVPVKAIYAGYLIRTRYSSLLCPYYMKAFMESQLYWEQLKNGTIATAQPNCNGKTLAKMLLPIPPINEQERIVEKLRNVSFFIERYGKSQSFLNQLNEQVKEQLKKSILHEVIQGKLVTQVAEEGTAQELLEQIRQEKQKLVKEGKLRKSALNDSVIYKGDDNKYYEQIEGEAVDITDDIPFEIPVNWIWIRLKDLCSIRTGATFKKEEASTEHKGIRVLRGGNIQRFLLSTKPDDLFISEGKVKYDILLKQNDIVTPAVTSLENIGKMARVEIDMPDTTVGGFVFIIRPFVKNDYVSKYLLAFMSSPTAVDYMQSITNKSGQAFYNIGKERLATTLVPLPPLAEQKRICSRISELFGKIKA